MKRSLLRILLILLFAAALVGTATSQDDPGSAPAGTPSPEPGRSGQTAEPLETFNPTEKVPADSAVAFPADI